MSKEQKTPSPTESVVSIPIEKLKDFADHPFSIRDDDAMQQTVESIREYGVLVGASKSKPLRTAKSRRRLSVRRTLKIIRCMRGFTKVSSPKNSLCLHSRFDLKNSLPQRLRMSLNCKTLLSVFCSVRPAVSGSAEPPAPSPGMHERDFAV